MSDETAVTRIVEMCREVERQLALAEGPPFNPTDYWTRFIRALLASGVVVGLPLTDSQIHAVDRDLLANYSNAEVNSRLAEIAHCQAEGAGT
jgi:hypothetical protein